MFRSFLIISSFLALDLQAQVIVNAPKTATNRVFINVIQFATTTGLKAQDFGTTSQEKYIKEQTDLILNQAGIDVEFSPTITVINDFAYDGAPQDYSNSTRPTSDLNEISGPLVAPPNFTDVEVINLYLVEIVPGFTALGDNSSNGLAYVDGNGIAMHIGSNLPAFIGGRDVIASVLAHEIGHNLGLNHTPIETANLMSPNGTTEQLTEEQVAVIFTDDFRVDGFDFAKPLADTDFDGYLTASNVIGGEDDDGDLDGLPNLLEFALGTDPGRSDSSRIRSYQEVAAGSITLDYRKQASALEDGVDYFLEYNFELTTPWENVGSGSAGTTLIEDSDWRIAGTNNNGGTEFMRLRVERAVPMVNVRTTTTTTSSTERRIPANAPIADCAYHRTVVE